MLHPRFLSFFLILLGLNIACVPSSQTVRNIESARTEKTEQEKQAENIALRDDTEAKMMRGEYLHDGALSLANVGDIESVPALLVVLEEYPPNPKGVMACPAAHALEALEKITGENPGYTHKAWSDWWKKYKKRKKISSRLEKGN